MVKTSKDYLPAAGHDWALPLYDPVVRLMGIGRTRDTLIEHARIDDAARVLEVGCGTGGLVFRVKQLHPQATVVGLDPDPRALARARKKIDAARLSIQLDEAYSDRMPYPDASFDRILSSFMFHHLSRDVKTATLREVRRVLRPGGSLHLLDFAGPRQGPRGFLIRLFHGDSALADSAEDRVITLMCGEGFKAAELVTRETTFFGQFRLHYYRAAI